MIVIPDTVRPERWIVQRAGTRGHYLPGWFAFSPDRMGESAWFPTQAAALAFADAWARRSLEQQRHEDALARWGVTYEPPPVKAPPIRVTPAIRQEILDLWSAGQSFTEISRSLGCTRHTIARWIKKVHADAYPH